VLNNNTAHTPVMIAPIGKIRICVPGILNRTPGALTTAAMPVILTALTAARRLVRDTADSMPSKNEASEEDTVVLAVPVVLCAVNVTIGVRSAFN
jgi:hypothetical protein